MATRRYSINPEDNDHQITEAAGIAVVTKNIEVTVDWDTLAGLMSGQQSRLQVINGLKRIISYIENTGKFNVNA